MHINNDTVHIAVAESSIIVRSGLITALKRLPTSRVYSVEVTSKAALVDCMQMHSPDILVINPLFEGGILLQQIRQDYPGVKYVALVVSHLDQSFLADYDGTISIFDNLDTIGRVIGSFDSAAEDTAGEKDGEDMQEALSQREKEIVVCVVKGMTNKEIAEMLFLSIHTVITHRRNISRKLQIHSAAGLTIYAIVNKLIDLKDVK